jgi:hypothetical protein
MFYTRAFLQDRSSPVEMSVIPVAQEKMYDVLFAVMT